MIVFPIVRAMCELPGIWGRGYDPLQFLSSTRLIYSFGLGVR